MEGTGDLQGTFAGAPQSESSVPAPAGSQWHLPLDDPPPLSLSTPHTATPNYQPRGLRAGPGTDRCIVTIPAPFLEETGKPGRFLSRAEQSHWLCPARGWGLPPALPGHPGLVHQQSQRAGLSLPRSPRRSRVGQPARRPLPSLQNPPAVPQSSPSSTRSASTACPPAAIPGTVKRSWERLHREPRAGMCSPGPACLGLQPRCYRLPGRAEGLWRPCQQHSRELDWLPQGDLRLFFSAFSTPNRTVGATLTGQHSPVE